MRINGGGNANLVIHVRDEKSTGTQGGTNTAATWESRTLNTVVKNNIPGASLASNQVTLPAGVYEVIAYAPSYNTNGRQTRIQNITDGTTILLGSVAFSTTETHLSWVMGQFTLTAAKAIALQQRSQVSSANNGFGAAGSSGSTEIYASMMIKKVG